MRVELGQNYKQNQKVFFKAWMQTPAQAEGEFMTGAELAPLELAGRLALHSV